MKVIRVQYTVRSEFAGRNMRNIEAVMRELRAQNCDGVRYAAYVHSDGKTFMHLVHHADTDAERFPASLPAFRQFQAQLKENLETPPRVESFTLADASAPIF